MRLPPLRSALRLALLLFTVNGSLLTETNAQAPKTYTSSEILLGLKKLNVLGSVLYIAAHPDDENTRLLAYLANERLLETGYLSCTRGDGGQNLIGPELGAGLGVIRTQELLAARRIDGARQFFTRANDFGFSKTAQETFTIWDREQVLSDMVWVIRQRRPDVLITRFPPDARAGHGHHTASAMLAIDAFAAAGDAKRFPEQLKYVQPWQPRRLLWNTGSFFVKPGEDLSKLLKLDAGGYNPLLGQSYGEIAARSRSQHRSQGFGSAATRGEALEYFQPLREGDTVPKELFEGVDLTWKRGNWTDADKVSVLLEEIIRQYDPSNPAGSVPKLLKLRATMSDVASSTHVTLQPKERENDRHFWLAEKREELDALIYACLGITITASTESSAAALEDTIDIRVEAINRSPVLVKLTQFRIATAEYDLPNSGIDKTENKSAVSNRILVEQFKFPVLSKERVSQPYWLREQGTVGMYKIPAVVQSVIYQHWGEEEYQITGQQIVGNPENPSFAIVSGEFDVAGIKMEGSNFSVPVQYKHTDPVLGEIYQPLAVVPPVAVNLPAARAYVFADQQPKTIPVTLRAGRAGVAGSLALLAPKGWEISPASAPFTLKSKDEEQTLNFQLRPGPGAPAGRAELQATATVEGQAYTRGIQTIAYPHIPTQTLFPQAAAPLVKLNVARGKTQQVGYLMGAGDEVPEALRQLGYTVTLLDPNTDLTLDRLRRFDAVVLGIRAYNTVEQLKTRQPELLRYVEAGGNLVVQYVVNRGTVLPQIGPYPLTLSSDRVTVESAPITLLAPQHPLLNSPNKITAADFQGWVQEQGLYYPSQWDPKYTPVIASNDPGETAKQSAILVADYGKGHYLYTGLSLFRELPAGVPGAYRILANLVSYGK
ncbi:PIG-L family deacetylase [uncultured Hymenobacter sp.]|uniref:PIG-L family deacetylase n=1 Tax=uncultured Hymenobacter sp. TaxID=170016 RepID=UPI0035C9E0E5